MTLLEFLQIEFLENSWSNFIQRNMSEVWIDMLGQLVDFPGALRRELIPIGGDIVQIVTHGLPAVLT